MATIDIVRTHGTSRDDARERSKAMFEDFQRERPELVKEVAWSGYTARASGKGFKGTVEVDDAKVHVAIDLALLVRPLKGRITANLERRLDDTFGRSA